MAAKIMMVYLMCTCSGQKETKEKKQTKKKKPKKQNQSHLCAPTDFD